MRKIAGLFLVLMFLATAVEAQTTTEVVDVGEAIVVGAVWSPSALSPAAATVIIDSAAIAASGATTVAELVATIPGIDVRSYGYNGSSGTASIRGGSGGHLVVVVDGVRVNDARSGSVDLSSINLAGVARVEILRSGTSALYGSDAIAGVIFITTDTIGEPSFYVEAATTAYPIAAEEGLAALLARQELRFAGKSSLGSLTLSASGGVERASASLPVADEEAGYAVRENSGLLGAYADVGAVAPIFTGILTIDASGRYEEAGVPGSLSYPSPNAVQTEYSTRGSLGWRTDSIAGGAAALDADVSWAWSRMKYVDPDALPSGTADVHDSRSGMANIRSEVLVGPALVRLGLVGGVDGASSTAIGDKSRLFAGAYMVPAFEFGALILTPSIRYDLYSDFDAGLSYGLGASWTSGNATFRANAASAYKAPSFNDLYWPDDGYTVGNPALVAERGWSAEAGAEYASKGFSASLFPFVRYVRDMIAWEFSEETFYYSPENIDDAVYVGADLAAAGEAGPGFINASYSVNLAKDISGGTAFQEASRLAFVPLHTLRFEAGARLGFLKASFSGSYRMGRLDSAGVALPDLLLLGSGLEATLSGGASVRLSAENILNEAYSEYSGYPMPGLSVTLSVRWDL